MRLTQAILVLPLLLSAALPARAASSSADAPHVHVQLVVPESTLAPGKPARAALYFKINDGWHIYWKNPGDAGLPPNIKWTLPAGVTAGPLQFPAPKRLPLPPLMDFGYENEALFPFKLDVAPSVQPGQAVLHAKVDWLVCQSSCIPGKAELEVVRPISAGSASAVQPDDDLYKRLDRRIQKLPAGAKPVFQPTKSGFRLSVSTGKKESQAQFFPTDQNILDNPAPQKLEPTPTGLILDLKKDSTLTAAPAQLNGVLELSGGRAYEFSAVPGAIASVALNQTAAATTEAAATTTQAAEATSQAANAATSAAQATSAAASVASLNSAHAQHPSSIGLFQAIALAFLGGLILNLMPCVFPVLFLKGLSLVNSGNEERHQLRTHGFVYTAGILASFWALVALLLGLRAAGATLGWGFQFQSPIFLSLMAALLFFLGLSLAGQFEIGLTLTSAGGSLAAKQGYTGSFFTGVLAVVVATPCTAPFMGAALGYALAQSAAVTFAVFTALALGLAAPYLALTLQPAWTRLLPRPGVWMEVLKQAVAIPIFATVIWLAWVLAGSYGASLLAALLASFLLLAVAGWFLGRWPAKRWSTTIAALIIAGVIAISALAPEKLETTAPTLTFEDAAALATLPSMQTGWQPWSPSAVARAQAAGRPVLVDFTAKWCLSCQVNERVALTQPEVRQALDNSHVALFKADWTRHDEAITQTLAALGRSGVPAYALYTPGQSQPELLPEVLTPGIILDAVGKLPKTTAAKAQ
jgi:thiol:disulfide interchange protein DsbD